MVEEKVEEEDGEEMTTEFLTLWPSYALCGLVDGYQHFRVTCCLHVSIFYPEKEFLQNAGNYPPGLLVS
jgi:hypothetical protein